MGHNLQQGWWVPNRRFCPNRKKGGTQKCSISTEVEGSDAPCRLRLRRVVVVVGLTLFLGRISSEDKTKDVGLAALFLSAVDFLLLSVS